jgi:hypothetical protein
VPYYSPIQLALLQGALLLALDTLNLALISHAFYFVTVTSFGDYGELGIPPW